MDGIESAELGGHGLGSAIEDEAVDLDELQGVDQCKDGGTAASHFDVGETRSESQAIEGAEALGGDECAGDASIDVPPLRKCVRLDERDAQEHGCKQLAHVKPHNRQVVRLLAIARF